MGLTPMSDAIERLLSELLGEMRWLVADPLAFRASNSWLQAFKRRFYLSSQRVTTSSMTVLNHLQELISEFDEHFVR